MNVNVERGKHCFYSCNIGKLDNLSYVKNLDGIIYNF